MTRIIALTAALLLAPIAIAGPLQPDRVPADARWLLHVDVEALVDSSVGGDILANAEMFDLELDEIEEELGLDPKEDFYSVTIYGEGDPDDEEDLVVMLETSPRVDDVLDALSNEDAYREIEANGYTLHRWDDEFYAWIGRADERNRRLVVMAGRKLNVIDALRVRDGKRKSLADGAGDDSHSVMGDHPKAGSLVFAFARGMPWLEDDDDPASVIARRSDRMLIDLREKGETATLHAAIAAKTEEDADNIRDVIQGVVALGRILSNSDSELDELNTLLNNVRVTSEGNEIRLKISGTADTLAMNLYELMEQID